MICTINHDSKIVLSVGPTSKIFRKMIEAVMNNNDPDVDNFLLKFGDGGNNEGTLSIIRESTIANSRYVTDS